MADMEKCYDDLIIINLYLNLRSWRNEIQIIVKQKNNLMSSPNPSKFWLTLFKNLETYFFKKSPTDSAKMVVFLINVF